MFSVVNLPLGNIHSDPRCEVGGTHLHSISLASRISLDVLRSSTHEVDDVTVHYHGQARVGEVHLNFLALVRAAARYCLEGIRREHRRIEDSRPLLDHERAYLRCVQDAASL